MRTRLAKVVSVFALGLAVPLATAQRVLADPDPTATVAPGAAAAPSDCEYIPGDGVSRPDLWSRTQATEIEVKGCTPQCIARVYCASDHPKTPRDSLTSVQKAQAAKLINCDANPMVNVGTPSCPLADACNRQAKGQSFRVARKVVPRAKGLHQYVAGNGAMYDVRYGLDPSVAHAAVPLFTFPTSNGEVSSKSCHVCASPASLGEGVKRFVLCPAKGGPNWGCDSGNDCATAQDAAADGELSAMFVSPKHIEHVEPLGPDGLPRGSLAGGAAADRTRQ